MGRGEIVETRDGLGSYSHIRGLQALSSHEQGNRPCPLCDISDFDRELLDHASFGASLEDVEHGCLHLIYLACSRIFIYCSYCVMLIAGCSYLHEPFDLLIVVSCLSVCVLLTIS